MLEEYESSIQDLSLIPSRGGVYEVVVDDRLIYSKKQTGRHVEHDDVLRSVRELAGS